MKFSDTRVWLRALYFSTRGVGREGAEASRMADPALLIQSGLATELVVQKPSDVHAAVSIPFITTLP